MPVRDLKTDLAMGAGPGLRSGPLQSPAPSVEEYGSTAACWANPKLRCQLQHGVAWRRSENPAVAYRAAPERTAGGRPHALPVGLRSAACTDGRAASPSALRV